MPAMPFGEAVFLALKMVLCALIAFAGGYWTISNWFDRRISGREAVLLLLGLLALMCFTVSLVFRGGPGVIVIAGAVFGAAGLLRLLAGYSDRRLIARLDEDEMAKYQRAIEEHPENPYAHSLLADAYRRLGQHERAAAEYEAALAIDPSLREERYWLGRTRTEMDRSARKGMSCPRCGAPRQGRELECRECGRPYSSLESWLHAARVMEPGRKALWLGVGVGACIAAAALVALAPGVMKAAGLLVLLAAPVAITAISRRIRRRTG